MTFRPLDGSDPEPGLFFVEREDDSRNRSGFATGMAFLLNADGWLATCSHLFVHLDRVPSEVVSLYPVDPALPIIVDAQVRPEGWRGPDWQSRLEDPLRMRSNWASECDMRPDVFRQDFALARLIPETARWDTTRGGSMRGEAEEALRQLVRWLPLAAPGYGHGARAEFKAWRVAYERGSGRAEIKSGTFRGLEPVLHDVIRVESATISFGCSGSPLWDPERQRVVGMVRRGLRMTAPNTVLGVDARAIGSLSGTPLSLDVQATRFAEAAAGAAATLAPLRHFAVLRKRLPSSTLPLRAQPVAVRDPLEGKSDGPGEGAIDLLCRTLEQPFNGLTFVIAGAGAGKSTLLFDLAQALIRMPLRVGTRRAIPLPIAATAFHAAGCDVAAVVTRFCASIPAGLDGSVVTDACILENDLCIVLLVDGLDELPPRERSKALEGLRRTDGRYRVIVTTRPIEDGGTDQLPIPAVSAPLRIELLPFGTADVDAFAALYFSEPSDRVAFVRAMNEIEWDRRGPLPLQLTLAAHAFEHQRDLSGRPVDLVFRLLDHLLAFGRPIAAENVFASWIEVLLGRIATYYLGGATHLSQIQAELERDQAQLPWPPVAPRTLLETLRRESELRDAVLALVPVEDDFELHWPHRSIAEALAARELSRRHREPAGRIGEQFDAGVRQNGQAYGLLVMAALDRTESGRVLVGLILKRYLDQGPSDYRSTVFSMRALGAGIEIDDAKVCARLVRTLVTLLLLPPRTRLGRISCAEVFNTEDLPDMVEIARRPHVRPLVAEQLHERWKRRHPSARNQPGPLRVSDREAQFLNKLALWWDIGLSLVPPASGAVAGLDAREFGSAAPQLQPMAAPVSAFMPPADGMLGAVLALDVVIQHLRQDASGFLSGLAERARQAPAGQPSTHIVRAYLVDLLTAPKPASSEPPDGTPA